ncbi:NAD-dependent protein deacetylase Sirt6 [Drosophila subpulchrella]|uniref:NAD-dependent protein deacetylase Sirt6 n=1 Tax=Drosophila subpulchrella TaxID=1486046 RepID=UPI0018A1B619|nr:NAD-dependent protein deacetylase Sirt6 [Drosophila subpulchrella]
MSCNYADGLSAYDNKGILGAPESFDSEEVVAEKCQELADLIKKSGHVVLHTGAGISTSAGIPDFRGPKGVWTLEEKGEKPDFNVSFDEARPTKTHMAIIALIESGYVQYVISQNIDGLHLKSGLNRKYLSELHGNIYIEQCKKCRRQFVSSSAVETVGQKSLDRPCKSSMDSKGRSCRSGILYDNVLDWEHDLPENDLEMGLMHSTIADLNIALGTTLQIVPSGDLPLKNLKRGGKFVICNLQPTKHDKKANLIISSYVDVVLSKVCKLLGVEIPEYSESSDPTKQSETIEWTIPANNVNTLNKQYRNYVKDTKIESKAKKKKYT